MRKLNLGCGHVQPAGWENVDGSLRAWTATRLRPLDRLLVRLGLLPPTEFGRSTRYASLSGKLPWRTGEAAAIYLGEVLEHFTKEGGERLIRECHRVLAPGGVIRVRVPDNARFWGNYLEEYRAELSKPRAEWTDRHTRWVEMFFRDICVRRRLGSFGHYHKFMYDEVSLVLLLERSGFVGARRMPFRVSAIEGVEAVEVRDDLIVEAVKPAEPPAAPADHEPGEVRRGAAPGREEPVPHNA
ncbi:MAG TPA: methyltransferase domain-containing protein [Gemmataceae bacterium]